MNESSSIVSRVKLDLRWTYFQQNKMYNGPIQSARANVRTNSSMHWSKYAADLMMIDWWLVLWVEGGGYQSVLKFCIFFWHVCWASIQSCEIEGLKNLLGSFYWQFFKFENASCDIQNRHVAHSSNNSHFRTLPWCSMVKIDNCIAQVSNCVSWNCAVIVKIVVSCIHTKSCGDNNSNNNTQYNNISSWRW